MNLEQTRLHALVDELRKLPAETPFVEFKENFAEPEGIGKRISAMANAARLKDEHTAYLIWGIKDSDHAVVGTQFEPSSAKVGNQPLELWLAQRLQPSVAFEFKVLEYQGRKLVILEIPAASSAVVEFAQTAFIRIGSATPKLSDYPDRLKALWAKLQSFVWESGFAAQFLSSDDVLDRMDHTAYFELTQQRLPDNRESIFERLSADRLIQYDVGGRWNITNLGAILFAKKLVDFPPSLARKAVRFVVYDGLSRANQVTYRQDIQRGYASGFVGLIDFIEGLLPKNEHIGKAFREARPLYPQVAVRELIANALIHQDMTITGAGPMIEMFRDRMEITNPGAPLMSPDRFLDLPPRSRNEALASLMRRMRLCEEQGTGIDKVLVSVELHHLPPPDFRQHDEAVRCTLFAPRKFADMTPEERLRACYQHAALRYLQGDRLKNASLCERLGIEPQNASQASVVIRKALDSNIIKPVDEMHPRMGYVPFWA